jgi:hypothetical protein
MQTTLQDVIRTRALKVGRVVQRLFLPSTQLRFIVAGGALGRKVNDIDCFPIDYHWDSIQRSPIYTTPLLKSKNAMTFNVEGMLVQLCNYQKPSMKDLIDSFDFAHCQIGAMLCIESGDPESRLSYVTEYVSDNYMQACAAQSTWFTGSEYPLSSLVRAGKYYKADVMPRGAYIRDVLNILNAVMERGVDSYDDFKDQLDAVDLGLLPKDFEDLSRSSLMPLYENLMRLGKK